MELGTTLKGFQQCLESIPEHDTRAKIGPRAFIIAFLFGFRGDRGKRSLESIRRSVMNATGETLSRGSFWERIAAGRLFHFLLLLAEEAMKKVAGVEFAPGEIKALLVLLGVSGILLVESSSMSLPDMAGAVLPGPRRTSSPAVIKWHSCFDLIKGKIDWFDLSPGTSHDQNHFPPLPSLASVLVIFDLGYLDYCLMQAIDNVGGFFLCRIKTNAVVKIGEVREGLPKKWKGRMLFDKRLPQGKSIIDVRGLFKEGLFEFRVVGFWNPIEEIYHWYATNLLAPARLMYPLYRLRWQTELLFKAAKSSLRLSDQGSANPNIVISLVLASIIVTTLSQSLGVMMARMFQFERDQTRMPSIQRAGIILAQVSDEIGKHLLHGTRASLKALREKLQLLAAELFDPNRKRETSIQRVLRVAKEAA